MAAQEDGVTINEGSRVWEGVYESFEEIPYERNVFEEEIWAEKLRRRAHEQLSPSPAAALEGDGITWDYALPVAVAMSGVRGRAVRVLDFGGGLGTTYLSVRRAVGPPVFFCIVESESICELGGKVFAEDAGIRFDRLIPEDEAFDIVHAGSSLHYVDDWLEVVRRLVATRPEYLVFADLPAGDIESFVTAQLFHGRRIPVRFWNRGEFVDGVESFGFQLVFDAPYAGRYLDPGSSLPTAHFDPSHRLQHCRQMIFRRRS